MAKKAAYTILVASELLTDKNGCRGLIAISVIRRT
jgi:hypothetical protein